MASIYGIYHYTAVRQFQEHDVQVCCPAMLRNHSNHIYMAAG